MGNKDAAKDWRVPLALVSTTAMLIAVSACAEGSTPGAEAVAVSSNEEGARAVSSDEFEQLLQLGVFETADTVPPPSTEAMALWADLVVEGEIANWRPGETVHYDNGDILFSTIVVELKKLEVLSGTLPTNTNRVYVSFIAGTDAANGATALPKGIRAVAYLEEDTQTDQPTSNLRGRGNGAPAGAQIWSFSSASGFVVDLGAGETKPGRGAEHRAFWPLLNHLEGRPLSDAKPGGPSTGYGKDARSDDA